MKPTGQSIPDRLAAFFRSNPDEELTIDDIATKFGCTRETAIRGLCIARHTVDIERVMVYRLREPK